jgi:hypothetical protein
MAWTASATLTVPLRSVSTDRGEGQLREGWEFKAASVMERTAVANSRTSSMARARVETIVSKEMRSADFIWIAVHLRARHGSRKS